MVRPSHSTWHRWVGAARAVARLVGIAAGIVGLAACAEPPASPIPADAGAVDDGRVPAMATVVRVVDGDTIVVRVGGRQETVRLIGIDTPETKKPGTPVECFGPEASAGLERLLPDGTEVRLERDIEARDRYGRLLAYVFRTADGVFVEEAMLADGMAATLDIDPNDAYRSRLHGAAATARDAGRGLWSACGGPVVNGEQAAVLPRRPAARAPPHDGLLPPPGREGQRG